MKDAADGRSRRSRLTTKGVAVLDEMLVAIGEFYEASLAGLSPEEQLALYRLLDRLKDGLAALGVEEDAAQAEGPEQRKSSGPNHPQPPSARGRNACSAGSCETSL